MVDQICIITIPYQSSELGYQEYDPWVLAGPHVLSTEQIQNVFPNVLVPSDDGFMPVQMEIKEASTVRGHLPARVCLLSNDGQTYKVFALPAGLY